MRRNPNPHQRRGASLRRVAVAVVAGFACLAVVTGCSSAGGSASSGSQSRFVAGDGSVVLLPVDERKPAPDITGTTLTGEPFALADYRGDVVALNVWASWCAPCRAEAPALNQVSRELEPLGVQFIGLDTRDSKASAEAFVRRFDVPYPNVWDPDAQLQLAFRDTLPPQAIPSTLLIDRQGRVAGRILGEVDRTQLRDLLTELANEPATP
ncbi:MAG: TlpA disulfide reductase family protein [Candidatus Nanopelagicales bacterium]